MLAALAQVTERAELGQLVTCAAYRNAGLLAKEAACVDVFSGGRLILGHRRGLVRTRVPGVRLRVPDARASGCAILDETLQVIPRLWTEETVTFDGSYVQLDGAYCDPKPIQSPRPPIWVGGGGEKVTLRIAAEHADTTNWQVGLEAFVHKSEVLRGALRRGSGATSTRSCAPTVPTAGSSTPKPTCTAGSTRPAAGQLWGATPHDDYVRDNFVGTVEQVAEKVQGFVDAGCREFVLWFRDFPSSESLERFRGRSRAERRVTASRRSGGWDGAVPGVPAASSRSLASCVAHDCRTSPAPPGSGAAVTGRARHAVLIVAWLAVAVVVAVVLRFVTTSDLWLDEALTVNIAKLPLGDLRAALLRDGAPPLYYVLLHGWMADLRLERRRGAGALRCARASRCWR